MQNKKITVIDSVMGSGKTSWAIRYINDNPKTNFIYVAPYLAEVDRIMNSCPNRFKAPHHNGIGKLKSFQYLLSLNADICCTHALFTLFDEETRNLIREKKYTIIIDEVPMIMTEYGNMCDEERKEKLTKDDLSMMFRSGCLIKNEDDDFLRWNPKDVKMKISWYRVKKYAEAGCLLYLDNSFLAWQYNPENFRVFDNIFILTYLFDGSLAKHYFDVYGLKYEKKSVQCLYGKYNLCEFMSCDGAVFKELVNIYEGKMNYNTVPNSKDKRVLRSHLSKTWFGYSKNKEYIAQLRRNLCNYFQNNENRKERNKMWTAFKDGKKGNKQLNDKGYTYAFIPCNCRATNDFSDRSKLAYCVNRFLHPTIKHFFTSKGISVDEDAFALSEFVQWIWRSRIRNGQPIEIYIPSKRMRNLLKEWLGLSIEE